MSHFAVIAPPFYSHFRAMQALALQLVARGHRITFVQQPDAAILLNDRQCGFCSTAADRYPPGSLHKLIQLAGHASGLGLFRLINALSSLTENLCRALPTTLNQLAVDGVIADQMEPAGGLVSEALGLPFISVACALPVNRENGIPLPVMPWTYGQAPSEIQRCHASENTYDWLMSRHAEVIQRYAHYFGLPARRYAHECLSELAQISQLPLALDFPRKQLPPCFHAVGPLRTVTEAPAPVPIAERSPRVFASLGTLQGHRLPLFKTFIRACQQRKIPLTIAHCGGLTPRQCAELSGFPDVEVTDFAQQERALQSASVVISHGGLNTMIDAVQQQTPLLIVPLAFDQPGVAARVTWHGIGHRLSRFAKADALGERLEQLIGDEAVHHNLARLRPALLAGGGATRAAAIAEQALLSRHRITAEVG
ncbi:glycosyltransferase [Pantoea sp. A4]|uniref:glycosyltransferase n=1 Tax=Pantoea sp. A4 TaxID=1225184 RepID=UPI00036C33DC|nr:glycosyltransferase [Pantoea sp. A4]